MSDAEEKRLKQDTLGMPGVRERIGGQPFADALARVATVSGCVRLGCHGCGQVTLVELARATKLLGGPVGDEEVLEVDGCSVCGDQQLVGLRRRSAKS